MELPLSDRRRHGLWVLLCALVVAVGCQRWASQETHQPDALPLTDDRRVYELIQRGKCSEAAGILDGFPVGKRDVQWFMRRGDVGLCEFRKSKEQRFRNEVVTIFETGMRAYPDSSRLMLEYGVACTAWDDLECAREWYEKARALAAEHIRAGVKAYGFDDEAAVKKQAEELLMLLDGRMPR